MLFKKIWDEVSSYVEYILIDFIRLILTFGVLEAVFFITDISPKPKIMEYMEEFSQIGILMIFMISVIFHIFSTVYIQYRINIGKIKNGG